MSRQDARNAKQRLFREPSAETDRVAYAIIGAAIEVHRHLGPGYLESIYEKALGLELEQREIPFERQYPATVSYKGIVIGEYRLDLVVDDSVVVELKAVESVSTIHAVQLISYLKVTNLELGLLINFNVPVLQQGIRRIVRTV